MTLGSVNWRTVPTRMPGWCWSFSVFLWKSAWGAHVPLLWHILVVAIAAIGTYFLTPDLTEKLERQKIRSAYISKNLDDMNALTGEFYVAVMQATSSPAGTESVEAFQKVDEIATKISWKSIQINSVLPSKSDQKLISRFQRDLVAMQQAAVDNKTPKGRANFNAAATSFGRSSVLVIQAVSARAELSE